MKGGHEGSNAQRSISVIDKEALKRNEVVKSRS
jgi:hypothetical protein